MPHGLDPLAMRELERLNGVPEALITGASSPACRAHAVPMPATAPRRRRHRHFLCPCRRRPAQQPCVLRACAKEAPPPWVASICPPNPPSSHNSAARSLQTPIRHRRMRLDETPRGLPLSLAPMGPEHAIARPAPPLKVRPNSEPAACPLRVLFCVLPITRFPWLQNQASRPDTHLCRPSFRLV
jgi:hypothetical protein